MAILRFGTRVPAHSLASVFFCFVVIVKLTIIKPFSSVAWLSKNYIAYLNHAFHKLNIYWWRKRYSERIRCVDWGVIACLDFVNTP